MGIINKIKEDYANDYKKTHFGNDDVMNLTTEELIQMNPISDQFINIEVGFILKDLLRKINGLENKIEEIRKMPYSQTRYDHEVDLRDDIREIRIEYYQIKKELEEYNDKELVK